MVVVSGVNTVGDGTRRKGVGGRKGLEREKIG